ncbi:alpha/beta hydrolase [Lactobacillus delbrueckii]|uniref:alpha/beta hydrolase n=2 Tax=Lactobacillus delbrueckii TaxID=1584 RepID=UPI001E2CD63A|nr:alpha/beta hydrolase [Lactobacillus delbrueckii]MCD5492135.1 alpha/beta hydrolase [Lactobacillus delbrueckii subsp. lactis]
MLYNEQRNFILLNYPIVYDDGGISDYQFLKEYFWEYKRQHPNTEMVLLGESYGGYLASLFAAEYIQKNYSNKRVHQYCLSRVVFI